MEGNTGLPPEIMVLCTTAETKDQAVRLLEWVRGIPDISELAWEPAIPAVCSLIASEQLGNTVVTERRAVQWSQSTPEQFRTIMNQVQKLLIASRSQSHTKRRHLTLQSLVDEFCPEQNALPHMLRVRDAFDKSTGNHRWQPESDLVHVSIFTWTCHRFKIPTDAPVEKLLEDHNIQTSDLQEMQDFLDVHCSVVSPQAPTVPHIAIASPSNAGSPSRLTGSASASPAVTSSEGTSTINNSVRLEELAHEFGVGEDAMGGMRFLEKTVREKDELKDLVDWDSTMGRCVIFYWTCSVLKIPSAKHITLRNQYHLSKRDFDKLLSVLDLHRADLRKKLEAFYTGNPALQLLPQSTHWPATSPAKPQYTPTPSTLILDKSMSPARRNGKKGTGKRGRPPKPKSPPPISTGPTSTQEEALLSLCSGVALRRALLLLRSFNARRHPASDADRVPPKSLPALIALVTHQQLGDGQMTESKASQSSYLSPEDFIATLATVRASIDNFHSAEEFSRLTTFDDLALEHGLGVDAVISMLHVREALKESRCLSIGMDWDSPLVKCSVFFWTCAILKVPDVKQSLLRSRSLASKREFDSMLQLLNSHCTTIRHQLEQDSAAGAFFFAPPPSASQRPPGRQHPSFYGEQEIYLEDQDGRPIKRIKREATTPSEYGSELLERPKPPPRKPGRPRKHPPPEEPLEYGIAGSNFGLSKGQGQIYRPTTQFPPADWVPPDSLSEPPDTSSGCPSSESGESKRRHTRYKTLDYEHVVPDRVEVWKPEGDDTARHNATYRQWEERMEVLYGPQWEKDIGRVETGTPFE